MDDLTKEQLQDITAAVTYYMQRHISVNNPRHKEYEVILQMLSKSIRNTQWLLLQTSLDNKIFSLKNHKLK